jgi:hypothetical protein
VIEILIFIAIVIICAVIVCWAIRALAAAFGPPDPARGQIVTLLIVLVVLIALLIVLQHLGYAKV